MASKMRKMKSVGWMVLRKAGDDFKPTKYAAATRKGVRQKRKAYLAEFPNARVRIARVEVREL